MKDPEILEVTEIPLDKWIALLRKPPAGKVFVQNMFPTDAHRDEWLQTSHLRSESEVKLLLRHFLVSTGSNLMDRLQARFLISRLSERATGSRVTAEDLAEHDLRLIRHARTRGAYPIWEGLGWIIDLLPQHPRQALNVIDAFFYGYWHRLTDNYLSGLFDALAIIRNRYIESSHLSDQATRALLGLDWRELEWLCGVVYRNMGFDIIVTPPGNDDGVDVFAANDALGWKGLVAIQAKRWGESTPVRKKEVLELLGAVLLHHATKGVMATTGRYQAGALKIAERDPRIELLDRRQILELLNEHCGSDWFTRVDRLITCFKDGMQEVVSRRPGQNN